MRDTGDDDEYIEMLLDVNHFYGASSPNQIRAIVYIFVVGLPIVMYIYFSLFMIIPIKVFFFIWLPIAIRLAFYILGDEPTRLKFYKKMLHNVYSSANDLLRITRSHDDGLVEFLGGKVHYYVVAYNGNDVDVLQHSASIMKFVEQCAEDGDYDIYIPNIADTNTLESRYKNVKLFGDSGIAKDFVDIIDHNSKIVRENSLLQKTIFVFKGYKGDWKVLRDRIDGAIHSKAAKCFKNVYRVNTSEEVEEILSRDLDGVISVSDVMRKKYCTEQYYGSKVLCYDDNKQSREVRRNVKSQPKGDFHVVYKAGGE